MAADPARVATAQLLLTQLGVTLTDLQHSTIHRQPAPSFADYLPRVIAAATPAANRLYGTYWNRMAAAWGDRPLDTILASDVEALQRQAVATARRRRNSRGGRQAGEHIISAARVVFNRAIADGLVDRAAIPAHLVPKPRRLPNVRRALTADELEQTTWSPAPAATTPPRRAAAAATHRNRLPPRRRPRSPGDGSRHRTRPGPAHRERRHPALATGHPRPGHPPG